MKTNVLVVEGQAFRAMTPSEVEALKAKAIENLDTPCPTHTPEEILRLIATLESLRR